MPSLNYVIKTNTPDSKDLIQKKKGNIPHQLFANYMLKSYSLLDTGLKFSNLSGF